MIMTTEVSSYYSIAYYQIKIIFSVKISTSNLAMGAN